MSARATMRHRCTIERNTTGDDDWGGPGVPGWTLHLQQQPCHAWFSSGKRTTPAGEDVSLLAVKLLLPLGTDVGDDDRISAVTDRRGRAIVDGPMVIDAIGARADHLELLLRETP